MSICNHILKPRQLKIYPNPASSFFTISKLTNPVTIKIYNIAGSLIREEKLIPKAGEPLRLDVSDLRKGIYFIKIGKTVNKLSIIR